MTSQSILDHSLHTRIALPVCALLFTFPFIASALGLEFYVTLVTRIMIFALAATSLNLILGFGGMVSFGHAAFVGIGAYVVAITMQQGLANAWVVWPLAVVISALTATVVGLVSLRTQGVYFIMITLAFAQMLYYLMSSLKVYGGDDGLTMSARSNFGLGLNLANERGMYYITLVIAIVALWGVARLLNARFGHALQAIRENEIRMAALGYPVMSYKVFAFALAGGLAGLSGVLLANLGGFVSPALLQWNQSGMLMIMVILGGVGYLYGGVLGAAFFLLLEEALSHYTVHWQLGLGAVLLLVVLVSPNGLASLLTSRKAGKS